MIFHLHAKQPENGARQPLILCVDDTWTTLLLNAQVLSGHGFNVLGTDDPKDALALLDAFEVDAVVTDYDMPGMNGGQLAHRIKSANLPQPVILRSGSIDIPEHVYSNVDVIAPKGQAIGGFLEQIESFLRRAAGLKSQCFGAA